MSKTNVRLSPCTRNQVNNPFASALSLVSVFLSLTLATIVIWPQTLSAAPSSKPWPIWQEVDERNPETIDHQSWQKILDTYLKPSDSGINLFSYAKVSGSDKRKLEVYLTDLQALDPRTFRSDEQLAYWINLYNALTVNLILDNYPVTSITRLGMGFLSFGPWDEPLAVVAGQELSLNDIEHRILRPNWSDPRIHFVVNCASLGCPNLQQTAFTAANVDELMNRAAAEFLSHPRAVAFGPDGKLRLSSIFDWYSEDFGQTPGEVRHRLASMAPAELAEKLRGFSGKTTYQYDWELNEYLGDASPKTPRD